jgi:hypothetical protein
VLKYLLQKGLIDGNCLTVTGVSLYIPVFSSLEQHGQHLPVCLQVP